MPLETVKNHSSLAWLMWGFGAAFTLLQFLLQGSVSVMVPHLVSSFNLDEVKVGVLSSSYFWTYLLLQIPAGIAVDRIGAKRLLSVAMVLCAIGCLIFAGASSYHVAIAGRMLIGLSTSPALVASFYLAANWFEPRRFAFVVGVTETIAMGGGAIGSEFLSQFVDVIGWRWLMVDCAGVIFILALATMLVLRDAPPDKDPQQVDGPERSLWEQLFRVIKLPKVWFCGLFAGVMFAVISALATLWIIPYLAQRYQLDVRYAALGSVALFAGAAIGSPLLGHLSDYVAKRRPLMALGTVLTIISLSLAIYYPLLPFAGVIALLFIAGFSCSVYILPFAVVSEITSINIRGTAMGFVNMMCLLLGAPILQPLIGWILRQQSIATVSTGMHDFNLHAYHLAFLPVIIILFLGLIPLYFIGENYCLRQYSVVDSEVEPEPV